MTRSNQQIKTVNLAAIFNAENAGSARGPGHPLKVPWAKLFVRAEEPIVSRERTFWLRRMLGPDFEPLW